jgi:hypothetical protein
MTGSSQDHRDAARAGKRGQHSRPHGDLRAERGSQRTLAQQTTACRTGPEAGPGSAVGAGAGQRASQDRGRSRGRQHGHEAAQLGSPGGDGGRELRASRAIAQVGPHAPAAKAAAIAVGDLAPNLLTRHGPALLRLLKRASRLEDGLFRRTHRDGERRRDVLV